MVAKNEAVEAKDAIENMSVSVTALDENAAASVTKSETDGNIHLSFGIPRGVKGEKGEPGNAGKDGTNGVDGTDGYTPVRGVDFMTEADFAYFDAHIDERLGEVGTALDELHAYAQALAAGGEAV
ncbi:MAG: hypothetical protein J6B12_03540 [Clostridia bacterium]|nr:hypothetical protein [Clostridia bacterium]